MEYTIRRLQEHEYTVLDDFLYEAIFIPEGAPTPPKSIILNEELQVYVKDFGMKQDDYCFAVEADGEIAGAVWARIMHDYGHVDDRTPSLAISLFKKYRGCGIGTELLKTMLEELKKSGYPQCSLSVQKANYAVGMYLKAGFEIIEQKEEEYIMVCRLREVLKD